MKKIFYFLYSFLSSLRFIFGKTAHYSIIFYSPIHFNRTKNKQNIYFKPLFDLCNHHNISYLYFEEPHYSSTHTRSPKSVPFDFLYYLLILLRKFMNSEMSIIDKDQKIGRFFKKTFLRNLEFDYYITLSQSCLALFRGINDEACLFDLQHGVIYPKKESYIFEGVVANNISYNNASLLVHGDAYKKILLSNEKTEYFKTKLFSIGYPLYVTCDNKKSLSKDVLVSLQFTNDHSERENHNMLERLSEIIVKYRDFNFYLSNHPRFNNNVDLTDLLKSPNVFISKSSLFENLSKCSLHLTVYSTTLFDASLLAIPTYIIKMNNEKFDIIYDQLDYPLKDVSLDKLYSNYSIYSIEVQKWARQYYKPFDKELFLSIFKG